VFYLKNHLNFKFFKNNFFLISYPILLILAISNYWSLCKLRNESVNSKNVIDEKSKITVPIDFLTSANNQLKIRMNDLEKTNIRENDQIRELLDNLITENKKTYKRDDDLNSEDILIKERIDDFKKLIDNLITENKETNIRIGKDALFSLKGECFEGKWNIAIGPNTQHYLCNSEQNIGIGNSAQYSLREGNANFALGIGAQKNLKEGNYNIGIGNNSMYSSKVGYQNIAIGQDALNDNTNGNNNIAIGYLSGFWGSESNNKSNLVNRNIWIGNFAGKSVPKDINDSIAIGFNAKNDKSNQVVIGTKDTLETRLNGKVLVDQLIFRKENIDLIQKINMLEKKLDSLEANIK